MLLNSQQPTPEGLAHDLADELVFLMQPSPPGASLCTSWALVGELARRSWPAAIRRALAAEAEVSRLRALVESLAERVAAQSELLTEKAQRPRAPSS